MMNKLNLKQLLFTFTVTILVLSSCKKEKLPKIDPQPNATTGVYVLCEGLYSQTTGSSASSITYFDMSTSIPQTDYFKKQNGTELGVNANDLKQYGSKMYCVITGTKPEDKNSFVEVMSIATGKSLKRIPFSDGAKGFLPRTVTFYKNKAYVVGFDGYVSKIDTASLTIESRIAVGGALDGSTIVNGKLYAANSDHPFYPNPNNSSLSVVDLASFTKLTDIPVNFNPAKVAATANGDIYVLTKGNYVDIPASLDKVSSVTDKKTSSNLVSLEFLNVTGTNGFVIGDYLDPYFKKLNIATGAIEGNFVTDLTTLVTPYGVTVNNLDNNVFVADANGYSTEGKMYCFSTDGKKRFLFATGALPQGAVFKYSYK